MAVVLGVEVLQIQLLGVGRAEGVGDGRVGEAVDRPQGPRVCLAVAAEGLGVRDGCRQRGGGRGRGRGVGSCAGDGGGDGRAGEGPHGEDGAGTAEIDAVPRAGGGAAGFGDGGRRDDVVAVALRGVLEAEVEVVSREAGGAAEFGRHAGGVGEGVARENARVGRFRVAGEVGGARAGGDGEGGVSGGGRREDVGAEVIGVLPDHEEGGRAAVFEVVTAADEVGVQGAGGWVLDGLAGG